MTAENALRSHPRGGTSVPLRNEMTMLQLKVQNGTPIGSESLCRSCRHAHVIRGARDKEEIILCRSGRYGDRSQKIEFNVNFCTEYSDRNHPMLWEMEKIAWTLNTNKRNGPVGFTPPVEECDED